MNIYHRIDINSVLVKLVFFVLGTVFEMSGISAQTIYTPKGTAVYCTVNSEWTSSELNNRRISDSLDIISNGYNAKIIGEPSNLYNCHFYAWHMSENSGAPYWLPPTIELLKFLEPTKGGDGSYMPCQNYSGIADKILIGDFIQNNAGIEGDHSMDYSPDPENQGKDWVSKWGPGALVRHGKYDHIYSKVSSNYYEYGYNVNDMIDWKNPYIDVPDLVCTKTRQTYNIVVDSHFRLANIIISNDALFENPIEDIDNKTVTLQPKTNAFGTCTISCIIENGCGVEHVFQKTISLGKDHSAPFAVLQDPSCMCAGQTYYIRTPVDNEDYTFNWQFQYGTVENIYHGCIRVTPYLNQGYIILTTTNECGVSDV